MRRRTIWLNLLASCASIPLNLMDVMSPLLELTAWACQPFSHPEPASSERTGEDQTSVGVDSPRRAGGGDAKGSKGGSNERDDGKESTEGLVQQHSDDQGPETSDKSGRVNRCGCAYSESQAQADEDRESPSGLRDLRCTRKSALICAGGIEQGKACLNRCGGPPRTTRASSQDPGPSI